MAREILIWIEPDGTEHNLTGLENIEISLSPSGRFMPPFNIVDQQVPFQFGSRLRQINVNPREIDLPIQIICSSTMELRDKLRQMMNIFNPLKGDGKLKSIAEDGSQRIIACRYQSGLEIEESNLPNQKAVIVLKAFDPLWYDQNVIVQIFTVGQPATFFPFPPLRLSNSTVFADTSINNTGDVEARPQWIITGPGDTIYLRNLTTGELININTSLDVGETINIDTRAGKRTIKKSDGTNLYPVLSDDSALWSLQQGINNIRIEMSNATSQSGVQLSYQNRYWST
jgi:phage-related protein